MKSYYQIGADAPTFSLDWKGLMRATASSGSLASSKYFAIILPIKDGTSTLQSLDEMALAIETKTFEDAPSMVKWALEEMDIANANNQTRYLGLYDRSSSNFPDPIKSYGTLLSDGSSSSSPKVAQAATPMTSGKKAAIGIGLGVVTLLAMAKH